MKAFSFLWGFFFGLWVVGTWESNNYRKWDKSTVFHVF